MSARTVLGALERAVGSATKALSVVGLAALLFLALLTLADGLGRWLLGVSIEGVRDIGGFVIAVAVSCCLPVGLMERGHITVRLAARFGDAAGRAADLLASLLVLLTMVAMAWQFYLHAGKLAAARETTWVLQIPVAPFWYGVDAILWWAVVVQALIVALDAARLARPAARAAAR